MEGKQPTHSEEIDLAYLFRPVTHFAQRLAGRTARHFAALKANIFLFISILLLISAAGYCLRFILPRSYGTEGIFATRFLPAKFCAVLTENLNGHVNDPLIAEQLHLAPDLADNIKSISLHELDEPLDVKDTMLQSFVLDLRLKKIDGLDSIQRSLVNYFENNEYAVKRKEDRRVALLALRQDIIARIADLDSLAPIVNRSVIPRSTGQGIILGQPIDPVDVYKAQDGFFKERIKVETELANLDNVQIVQSFLKLNNPNHPRFWLLSLWSIAGGLVLAILLTPALGRKR
jgi:hypothetical protein